MQYSFNNLKFSNIAIFLLLLLINSALYSEDIRSKTIYLEYTSYPKRVFTGQNFNIKLKATILTPKSSYDKIITTFVDGKYIDIVDPNIQWKEISENIFTATVRIKVHDRDFTLPDITIGLVKDNSIIDYKSIKLPTIKFEKIAIDQKLFSNVIASDLEINTVKTKQYNNNLLLTTINIEAKNSNLEDIFINKYKDQGIKSLNDKPPYQSLYYYVIIPSHTKEIKFTYYNSKDKDFVYIRLPITLDDDLVSTQTDLNPYNSSILIYKQILVIALLIISIILYGFTNKSKYLILIAILIIFLAYLFIPNKKIILDTNTDVYILPTPHSTIYKKIKHKVLVEIINEKNGYTKVLFKNQNIGWVKDVR